MSDGGKGSVARPFSVDQKTFADNWDAIFGKKNKKEEIINKDVEKINVVEKQQSNQKNAVF